MSFEEKTLNSIQIFDGKVVKLFRDEIELPNGKKSFRECVRNAGGAAVLFVKDNKIALVKQFRYLYGKEIYEIPAGKLNKGEDAMESAARELEEETGYKCECISHLADVYPTPGYTDEIISVFYVDKAKYVGQNLDDGEFLQVGFYDIDVVKKMIDDGEICDSKTVIAVYKYLLNIR